VSIGPHVLLVEDPTLAGRTARLLAEGGVEADVAIVSGVEAALELLRAGGVDLLVVDLALAGHQGLDLLAAVRGEPALAPLPVVVLSGTADPELIRECYDLGADCFVRKPRRIVELVPAVRAIGQFWDRHTAVPDPGAHDDSVFQLPLAPTGDAVREARSVVRDVAEGWGLGALGEIVELCTSELATNALVHANSPVLLVMSLLPESVRIEVEDAEPGGIEAGGLIHDAESGRGLAIVDAMTESWGVEQHDTGKVVWFQLHRPDQP